MREVLFAFLGLVSPLARKTHLGAEGAVFARLPFLFLLPYCGPARSGAFPRTQESGSPIWSPRARAPFSNHHQTAGKQPRLSRGFSMGPWPSRGSNGLPWRGLDTEARVFVRFL
jgi:hypothetical protein